MFNKRVHLLVKGILIKTHILYPITYFFRKSCRLSDNVEK